MAETDLVLGDIVFPVGSDRGISQTLNFIDNGNLRRTVNGELKDLTRDENRKFESNISITDQASPAFEGFWKGQTLDPVECIKSFRETISPAAAAATLIRDPVSGSVKGLLADGSLIDPDTVVNRDITFSQNVVAIIYRPSLVMMIDSITSDRGEFEAEESWSITLREV